MIDFTISSFVDQFSNSFSSWITIGDVWFNFSEQVSGGFINSNECTIVDLSESQKSENSN